MFRLPVSIALILAVAPASFAAESQVGRKFPKLLRYEEVTITKIEPDGIRIVHKSGVAKIPVESLPPSLAAELGLNAEDAAMHRRNQEAKEREQARNEQARDELKGRKCRVTGTILQVQAGGVLVSPASFTTGRTKEIKVPYTIREGGPTTLMPKRKVTVQTLYRTETVPETVTVEVAYVACDTKPLIDGMAFDQEVFVYGKYTYAGADGAQHTVPAFTRSANQVLEGTGLADGKPVSAGPASGTGFFVSPEGHLLTNHHVVEGRTKIEVRVNGRFVPATVVKSDAANDVALLKVENSSPAYLNLGDDGGVGLGQEVFTVGFPQITVQGASAKFTEGSISSTTGAGDDPRYFQISVPIQPGNSGSPLVNAQGTVIGIVSATLRSSVQGSTVAVNQNVNYAIKIAHAKRLIGSSVTMPPAPKPAPGKQPLVQSVEKAVALIRCP